MTPTTATEPRGGRRRLSRPSAFLAPALGAALIAALTFAGCTCAGKPGGPGAPAGAARATPPAVAPTPTPVDLAALRQKTCEGFVATLAGRQPNAALYEDEALRALAGSEADLVTCGAVVSDSETPCLKLLPVERGPSKMCLHMRAIFHELRTYPQGRSFLLDEIDWAEWQPLRERMPAAFDALRAATRSGDVAQCEQAGDMRSICRAYLTLDAAQCRAEGDLAAGEVEPLVHKEGDSKADLSFAIEDGCRQTVESRAFLAAGLKGLAESGPPRERVLAKAALGDATACAAYEQVAMTNCLQRAQAGSLGTPVSGTPVPSVAAPPAGAPPAAAPPAEKSS